MKIFTQIDNAIKKTTEFINSKTEQNSGWGEKADQFFANGKNQTTSAAKTAKDKTFETFENVGETVNSKINDFFNINTSTEEETKTEEAPESAAEQEKSEQDSAPEQKTAPATESAPAEEESKPEEEKTYTLAELKDIAKERGITGYSNLRKKELQALLGL